MWGYLLHSSKFRWEIRGDFSSADMALTTWYTRTRGVCLPLSLTCAARAQTPAAYLHNCTQQQGGALEAQISRGNVNMVLLEEFWKPSQWWHVRLEPEGRSGRRVLVVPAWTLSRMWLSFLERVRSNAARRRDSFFLIELSHIDSNAKSCRGTFSWDAVHHHHLRTKCREQSGAFVLECPRRRGLKARGIFVDFWMNMQQIIIVEMLVHDRPVAQSANSCILTTPGRDVLPPCEDLCEGRGASACIWNRSSPDRNLSGGFRGTQPPPPPPRSKSVKVPGLSSGGCPLSSESQTLGNPEPLPL